jgi:2-keto-3-deoxy-L-rhamnonate aldolase RhmA
MAQFESGATDDLDAAMRALDIAFIGMVDLTIDLGVPGEPHHPAVRARVAEIEAAARRTGVPLGAVAATMDAARGMIADGYRLIALGSDVGFLAASVLPLADEIRAARAS